MRESKKSELRAAWQEAEASRDRIWAALTRADIAVDAAYKAYQAHIDGTPLIDGSACPTCDGNGQYDTSNDPDKAETVNCETCGATGLVGVAS